MGGVNSFWGNKKITFRKPQGKIRSRISPISETDKDQVTRTGWKTIQDTHVLAQASQTGMEGLHDSSSTQPSSTTVRVITIGDPFSVCGTKTETQGHSGKYSKVGFLQRVLLQALLTCRSTGPSCNSSPEKTLCIFSGSPMGSSHTTVGTAF